MLVPHLVRFSLTLTYGSSLSSLLASYFFTYFSRKTAALPTLARLFLCHTFESHINTQAACVTAHACWFDGLFLSFVLFCFDSDPIRAFLGKQRGSCSFTLFFSLSRKPPVRPMRLSHYDFITEDGGIRGLLCYYCFLPTCARFVYIFSSSCFPFFSLFFVSCFVCIISV